MRIRRPFQFRQFTVTQENVTMPVTTDACLFGMLIPEVHAARVLDIGTGTGLLALIMAQRFGQARITGVEMHEPTWHTAAHNFGLSPWADRLQAVRADIRAWSSDQLFDLIVCNPPFFHNQLPSSDPAKRRARHTETLGFDELLNSANRLLTDNGTLCVLLPCLHTAEVLLLAGETGLYATQITEIRATDEKTPHVAVVVFKKCATEAAKTGLTVYASPGVYTPQTRELLSPLYPGIGA